MTSFADHLHWGEGWVRGGDGRWGGTLLQVDGDDDDEDDDDDIYIMMQCLFVCL